MKQSDFAPYKRLQSFKYALEGLKALWVDEPHFRLHVLASATVITLALVAHLHTMEWVAMVLCMVMEEIHSAIENLADVVSPDMHPLIKKAKDLSAPAVLISALASVAVGCLIFIPKIFNQGPS